MTWNCGSNRWRPRRSRSSAVESAKISAPTNSGAAIVIAVSTISDIVPLIPKLKRERLLVPTSAITSAARPVAGTIQ